MELARIRLSYKFPSDTSASDSQTSLSVAKLRGIKIGKTYLRRYDYGLHIKPQDKRKHALFHAAEVGIKNSSGRFTDLQGKNKTQTNLFAEVNL